jgi:hypothetical protein
MSIGQATSDYSAILGQLSQTAARLQEETEDLEPQAPSAVLPLASAPKRKKTQIQKPVQESPA